MKSGRRCVKIQKMGIFLTVACYGEMSDFDCPECISNDCCKKDIKTAAVGVSMNHCGDFYRRQDSWFLLFWPMFGLRYLLVETWNPADYYHPVYCSADEGIPFLEIFLIPYILWYFCMVGVHLWLYRCNDPVFRMYSWYLTITMSISTAIFLLYPTCQNLRPVYFERNNFLTSAVRLLYRLDTSTNVCPSEHVIGSAGFFLAVLYAQNAGRKCRLLAAVAAFLTASATVFLKQHSLVDVVWAFPVCFVGWYGGFHRKAEWKITWIKKLFPGERSV